MGKRKTRKRNFKRIFKIHALATFFVVALYLGAGFVFGFGFLFKDIQNKYNFAAYTVFATVRVWGPPAVPEANVSFHCDGGDSYVLVDWESDENATSYDVFRNSEELITGLVSSSYQDHNVNNQTAYSYFVVAHGPQGDETSAEVAVTTGECNIPFSDPEISVTRFEDFDMTNYHNVPFSTDRKPEFYGTSNIANASVRVELFGNPFVVASTVTNSNGSWSWTPASNLSYGPNTAYFTIIDPFDLDRTATTVFHFRIRQTEDKDDEQERTSAEPESIDSQSPDQGQLDSELKVPSGQDEEAQTSPRLGQQSPIDMALKISKVDGVVVRGTDLSTQVYPGYTMTFEVAVTSFSGLQSGQDPLFVYRIIDSQGEEVYRLAEQRKVQAGDVFSQKITLPKELEPGKYKLQIEAIVDDFSVSEERYFYVQESPITAFSGNFKSFIIGFIDNLGWLAILLLLILLFLVIFAIVEYKIHHDRQGASCNWPRHNPAKQ